jgi:hypothetical protein
MQITGTAYLNFYQLTGRYFIEAVRALELCFFPEIPLKQE